jgi:phosphomannomutase/phosphoglucomutase
MGFAFDGDGDRLGLIDNKGNVIWADRQMILYARDILSRNQETTRSI